MSGYYPAEVRPDAKRNPTRHPDQLSAIKVASFSENFNIDPI
jgi:hypothetical protein